jgi:glycosyltransferase involved in cell wall biosynthesis
MGFFGVIDERLDTDLVAGIADLRPDWSFVMLGPVVKIDSQSLPQRPNIHWIGGRDYQDLPQHLAHWDVGIMPFALNEATRFISPTKTPEFLAAGLPVVSSPIADVVRPYGELGLVEIAADAEAFVRRCEEVLVRPRKEWLADVDTYLSGLSWDRTWNAMHAAMKASIRERRRRCMPSRPAASLRPEPEEGVNVRV